MNQLKNYIQEKSFFISHPNVCLGHLELVIPEIVCKDDFRFKINQEGDNTFFQVHKITNLVVTWNETRPKPKGLEYNFGDLVPIEELSELISNHGGLK